MPWQYSQSSGRLTTPAGTVMAVGYSGAKPNGYNQPSMQAIEDIGPIPQGMYTFAEPIDTTEHGPYAIPLIPDESNEMFGRSQFLCHGDKIGAVGTASKGCLIQPRFAREGMWQSDDHRLQVIA